MKELTKNTVWASKDINRSCTQKSIIRFLFCLSLARSTNQNSCYIFFLFFFVHVCGRSNFLAFSFSFRKVISLIIKFTGLGIIDRVHSKLLCYLTPLFSKFKVSTAQSLYNYFVCYFEVSSLPHIIPFIFQCN